MQTLCIVGEDCLSAAETLTDRLTTRREGRVATVDCTGSRPVDGAGLPDEGEFRVDGDGRWVGAGSDRSATELLDSLARRYDYALLAGVVHHRLPTVVLGDVETPPSTPIVETTPTAAELDPETILGRIDELDPYISLETLVDRAKASPMADRAGAIATFTGRVRAKDDPADARTERLTFEKYEGVAEQRLDAIRQDLTAREGVFEVLFHHRVGPIDDGEDIVFVVVLAGHRRQAFRAVEDGIDRLKDEVPIFKKESTTDGDFWLHER
ncbi:molybdopterin synthase [Halohasta salina]|uniref:molybdopterin synthase n=1 Tax=Halohasta salina TaxID=2961621 RepID=UPI0020A498A9|nr:molybdopterin synthase [Halohasta salina]